jgi:hypothetical protein
MSSRVQLEHALELKRRESERMYLRSTVAREAYERSLDEVIRLEAELWSLDRREES